MKMPQMNTCCFNTDVRTSTQILLILSLNLSIVSAVLTMSRDGASESLYRDNFKILEWMFKSCLLFGIILAALGLYGVYKKKASYLIPYLVNSIITIFVEVLIAISIIMDYSQNAYNRIISLHS